MEHIKIIKTPEEHEQAMARVMLLMDADPQSNSQEADELDLLALLVENYEKEQFPIEAPGPLDAICFRMDQQGLKQKDLIPYIGSASKVSEVLNGTRNLSIKMIRKLTEGLGIPADILIREPSQKAAFSQDINWLAFPLAEMRKGNYFDGFNGSLPDLKEYAGEWVAKLLSHLPSGGEPRFAMLRTTAHLNSNDKEVDPYALMAWQARVLQKAQTEKLAVKYKKGTVNLGWLRALAQLSWSEKGPLLAIEYLNKAGIHLIIEPHLTKTYLDGAVSVAANGNPVVALTLRYNRLDNFWFTLMHELAHVALHLDGTEAWIIDNFQARSSDPREDEADGLAQNALIPDDVLNKRMPKDVSDIRSLAQELNISPCIIAGRLRHESGDHKLFSPHFSERVYF